MNDSHLLPLGGSGEWGIWPSLVVRTTGMPFDWLSTVGTDSFEEAKSAALEQLCTAARDDLFQGALAWQNPLLGEQVRKGAHLAGRRRRHVRRSLAAYLSRYCAKNDTIGCFGPSVWGTWNSQPTRVTSAGRPPKSRDVYMELWAVRTLARALRLRHGLDPWVVPHIAPSLDITREAITLQNGSRLPVTPLRHEVLKACDGTRAAYEIPLGCPHRDADEVRVEVRRLQAMGVLSGDFAIRQARRPERQLRGQLMRVSDVERRTAALRDLDEVTLAVAALKEHATEPERLAQALTAAEEVFVRITGEQAEQGAGQFYAGKRIAYEDCIADLDVELGPEVLGKVGPVLELVLISSRWFSHAIAAEYIRAAWQIMEADEGQWPDGYPFSRLLAAMSTTFWDDAVRPVDAARAELRSRWTKILLPNTDGSPTTRSVAELRDAVHEMFPASGPAWTAARWHSPDLMIDADSVDSIRAGRFQVVLGELHSCINTVNILVFLDTAPNVREVRSWMDREIAGAIFPLYPFGTGHVNSRSAPPAAHLSSLCRYIGVGNEPAYQPSSAELIPAASLRVVPAGGGLRVVSADGAFEEDLVEVLGDYLSTAAAQSFGFLEPQAHQPRVTVDDVVVCRETWRVPFADFPGPNTKEEPVYAFFQALRERLGIPQNAFVRVAGEVKPVYVDLANALMVDMLWSKIRRGRGRVPDGDLAFSELLPGPDGMWLKDDSGQRYPVEFRIVSTDRKNHDCDL
ncbi:lantibiotic dehydratase [Micromonospora sp. NPDC050495]|uniref:lantibiotic dehydratase n=1 Tax=Micromonospora sp. NPDC050495 TaxID=3154936 RepID=UPI0033C7A4F8